MGRDGTPDHTWPEDIRSSKRFPKKSNANATNNLAVPVGRVPRAHRLILEYQKKAPLPWCLPARSPALRDEGRGEDEGEGGTKFGVSTPTLDLPHQGGGGSWRKNNKNMETLFNHSLKPV
jgi:hypothetical protein